MVATPRKSSCSISDIKLYQNFRLAVRMSYFKYVFIRNIDVFLKYLKYAKPFRTYFRFKSFVSFGSFFHHHVRFTRIRGFYMQHIQLWIEKNVEIWVCRNCNVTSKPFFTMHRMIMARILIFKKLNFKRAPKIYI